MQKFVDNLVQEGWLKTDRIIDAFYKIKRRDFVPDKEKELAGMSQPLPIGWGQTISQPQVVAFMLELLGPKPSEKILDVGSGSGWTSALLGEIVGEQGKIIAMERIPELKEFGEKNVAKYNFIKKGIVECICGDGSKGYSKKAPFDKILCSAAVKGELPLEWQEQLKVGGLIVTPIGSSIWAFKKKQDKEFETEEHPGFLFVPLVEE